MFNLFKKTWKNHFDAGMRYGAASDFTRAEASFREAVRLAPDEPYPHYELGYTLFLAGKYEEALPELRRTNELSRGFFLVQQELFMCEQVIAGKLSQDGLQLLRSLQRLTDSGATQTEEAATLARLAVNAAPECALVHFYLGKALLGSDPVEAENALRRCLALDPDETTAIDAKTHLGTLRRSAGAKDEALQIWRGVIADYDGNPHTKVCEFVLAQNKST